MPDGFGRMTVEAEVAALDAEVRGDGDFFAGFDTEEGAIVTDAETQAPAPGIRTKANATENLQFAVQRCPPLPPVLHLIIY